MPTTRCTGRSPATSTRSPPTPAATAAVSGSGGSLANPGIVMHYSIGQTTMATRQAIANLYYRSVRVVRPVEIGQTLTHRHHRARPQGLGSRRATSSAARCGSASSPSSEDGPVVEYERCALVRGNGPAQPGHDDDIPGPSDPTPLADLAGGVPGWDLSSLPAGRWEVGETRVDPLRDHVDLAAPFARLTFNQAAVHRDVTMTANGKRLVYGGHVQGLAQASLHADAAGPRHRAGLGRLRPRRPRLRGRPDRVPPPARRGRHLPAAAACCGSRRSARAHGTDILRWTPIAWAP